jgi:hypothetical protein
LIRNITPIRQHLQILDPSRTRNNKLMAIVASGLVNQRKISAAVERAAKALSADVVRIRFDLEDDWTGNPSLFFKIVITDQASRPERLREVSQRVTRKIMNEAKVDQAGLLAYFSFRSQSEHAKMKDPEWA